MAFPLPPTTPPLLARAAHRRAAKRRKDDTESSDWLEAQRAAERHHERFPRRDNRIDAEILRFVSGLDLSGRTVLEVGGRRYPRSHLFEPSGASYVAVDLDPDTGDGVVAADICSCPELPSDSVGMVVSVDVFEHLAEPWRAAKEICRILEPGGVAYTSTLFSWRYHPVPADYWRFTPAALELLFSRLDLIESGFDDTERRRNITGKGKSAPIEQDAFGGWRENWRVFHVGRKPRLAAEAGR